MLYRANGTEPLHLLHFSFQFDSNEAEELLDAAAKYMEQVEKQHPNRTFTTAVIDINGKTVFVTKYFKALAPPEAVLALPGNKEVCVIYGLSSINSFSLDIFTMVHLLVHQLWFSKEHHKLININAPPHIEACFWAKIDVSGSHSQLEPSVTGVWTQFLVIASPAL